MLTHSLELCPFVIFHNVLCASSGSFYVGTCFLGSQWHNMCFRLVPVMCLYGDFCGLCREYLLVIASQESTDICITVFRIA